MGSGMAYAPPEADVYLVDVAAYRDGKRPSRRARPLVNRSARWVPYARGHRDACLGRVGSMPWQDASGPRSRSPSHRGNIWLAVANALAFPPTSRVVAGNPTTTSRGVPRPGPYARVGVG